MYIYISLSDKHSLATCLNQFGIIHADILLSL